MKQSRNRQRGKESEKVIAKMFNGKRMGILGGEDVINDKFSIEVKSRKSFVAENWMKQAIKNNIDNKIPLVVVHKGNSPHNKDLVLININDFLNLV